MGALIALIGRAAGRLAKLLKLLVLSNNRFLMIAPPTPIMLEVVVYENNKSINALKKKKIDSLMERVDASLVDNKVK